MNRSLGESFAIGFDFKLGGDVSGGACTLTLADTRGIDSGKAYYFVFGNSWGYLQIALVDENSYENLGQHESGDFGGGDH